MSPLKQGHTPTPPQLSWQAAHNQQAADVHLTNPSSEAQLLNEQRYRMVHQQVRVRGIDSLRLVQAMSAVPRHKFVRPEDIDLAYTDQPLPIGYGQTISQPYIVAFMVDAAAVQPTAKVLEIGTGSGYQTAILSVLAKEVYSVDIIPQLTHRAAKTLNALGYHNVQLKTGNGYDGWAEHAPYDAIIVTAAPTSLPPALVEQLAPNGKLVVPIGEFYQNIFVFHNTDEGLKMESTIPVRFVPMTGRDWQ